MRVGSVLCLISLLSLKATAASIVGQSVTMDYRAAAFPTNGNSTADTQTAVIGAGTEFTARSPVAPHPDLFDVDIADSTLTITALMTLTNESSMEFHWDFIVDPLSSLSFSGASLVSNILFSIPPFTFPVDPTLSVDGQTLSVDRFLACGVGTCAVSSGGSLKIAFSIVPEPTTSLLLACGLVGLAVRARSSS